jgi:hypothetical protein
MQMQPKKGELVPSMDILPPNHVLAIAPIPVLTTLPSPIKACALPIQLCMDENAHLSVPKSVLIDIEKIEDLWVGENGDPISEVEKQARNSRRIVRRPPISHTNQSAPIVRMNNNSQTLHTIQPIQHSNDHTSHLPINSQLTRNRLLVNDLLAPTETSTEQNQIPAPIFTIDPKLIPAMVFNLPPTETNTINHHLAPKVQPKGTVDNFHTHSGVHFLPITPAPTTTNTATTTQFHTIPTGQEVRFGWNGPAIANSYSIASNDFLLQQANMNNFIG